MLAVCQAWGQELCTHPFPHLALATVLGGTFNEHPPFARQGTVSQEESLLTSGHFSYPNTMLPPVTNGLREGKAFLKSTLSSGLACLKEK